MTTTELTTLRKEAGTQDEVARLLGVGKRTIERAENDPAYPRRVLIAYAIRGLLSEARRASG